MSRAIVSTRAFRRRIPSELPPGGILWTWAPLERRKAKADLAFRGVLFLGVGILALVAFQVFGMSAPPVAREDEVLWLETPPKVPSEAAKTESVVVPPPVEAVAEVAGPLPLDPTPQPAVDRAPEPTFGMDDAVETGGLAVATGTSLAAASEPVVRDMAPAGPVLLQSIPGSTKTVLPRYPPRAEAIGLEAKVVALVTTDTSGNVVGFRIEKSGGRDFDESVRRAALSTRFSVPRREGRAQAVAFRLPYSFRLE